MERKKILVLGGSGLIGAEVCRAGVARGHEVVSVSRSARPTDVGGEWMERVSWQAADALEPEQWRDHLAGCNALVHSIGIIQEKREQGITFERINGESAIVAAAAAARAGVECVIFVSASQTPPGISPEYLRAKRRAEESITALPLRGVLFRPALVYGARRPQALFLGLLLGLASAMPGLGQWLRGLRPLSAEQVGDAAIYAIQSPSIQGIVSARKIEALAKALAWGL